MPVTWKKLAYETDVVTKATFVAVGDIIYCSALTPTVISPLTIGNAGDVLTVAGGVPTWAAPAAPAAHTLDSHSVPVGAVDFDLQQATDLILMTVANEAALPVVGMALGQIAFAAGELTAHICTAIA